MTKCKLVGAGAAGNKATILLIEQGVVTPDKVMLINSTMRDIPDDYKHLAELISDNGGCGKETSLAAELCLQAIKEGTLGEKLDSFIEPEDELCIIVGSLEGGSGNGSTRILAKYLKDVIGIPVMCFGFGGFNDDARGMQNTIEYFQNMREDYGVQAISNKKFLDLANGNKLKAEKAANEEFVQRMRILIGKDIIDSEQNIDETDLYKVASTPGYMIIGKTQLKIKNVDQFNRALIDMLDENKSLETTKSTKRLAVFLNVTESTRDHIDYRFSILRERLGTPYEVFTHVQYDESQPEYISFIASGLKMPLDEVKEVYERYTEESDKVDKKQDSFFSFASNLRGNEEDSSFNVHRRRGVMVDNNIDKKKSSFFDEFKEKEPVEVSNKVQEPAKREVKLSRENFVKDNF